VPPEWAETRMLGSATQSGSYADIYGGEWIAILRRDLAADCIKLAIVDPPPATRYVIRWMIQTGRAHTKSPLLCQYAHCYAPPVHSRASTEFSL
jgi:hypothetical protein